MSAYKAPAWQFICAVRHKWIIAISIKKKSLQDNAEFHALHIRIHCGVVTGKYSCISDRVLNYVNGMKSNSDFWFTRNLQWHIHSGQSHLGQRLWHIGFPSQWQQTDTSNWCFCLHSSRGHSQGYYHELLCYIKLACHNWGIVVLSPFPPLKASNTCKSMWNVFIDISTDGCNV